MEVRGQIAWRTESKKTAGMRFVGLPEDSRRRISEWLAAETSGRELRPDVGILPDREQQPSDDAPAEMPVAPLSLLLKSNTVAEKRMLEAILSEVPFTSLDMPARVFAESPRQSTRVAIGNPPSRLATPDMPVDTVPAAADALPREFSNRIEFNPESRLAFRPVPSEEGAERLRRLAAAVILAGATAVFIGWVATSPAAKNEVIGFVARNTERTNKAAELKKSLPANKATNAPALRSENGGSQVHRFEPLPADRPAYGSETRPAPVRPEVRGIEGPAARPTVNGSVRRTESLSLKSRSSKLPERAIVAVPNPAVESARSQAIESSPTQPMGNTAAPATSLPASVPGETSVADVKEKESPPFLKQPGAPMGPMWSVAVTTDPYPSIRITPDNSPQKASHGRSLQIGRTILRVEPIYPEDAKQQGIEGTVKLHVVVGRDGAVQSVEPISGPALLARAATSAVREWRYAQTLLGGQPVETEQDIVVKFGLVSPSISKN
jgi:protein TonB